MIYYDLVFSERLSVVNSMVLQLAFCWYIRRQDWVLPSHTPAGSEPGLSVCVARGRKTFWLGCMSPSCAHRPHAEEEWWTLALSSSAKCTLGLLCLHSENSRTFRRPFCVVGSWGSGGGMRAFRCQHSSGCQDEDTLGEHPPTVRIVQPSKISRKKKIHCGETKCMHWCV